MVSTYQRLLDKLVQMVKPCITSSIIVHYGLTGVLLIY